MSGKGCVGRYVLIIIGEVCVFVYYHHWGGLCTGVQAVGKEVFNMCSLEMKPKPTGHENSVANLGCGIGTTQRNERS